MYFLTDTISADNKSHAKPSFESDDLFKQSIGCDSIKILNKFQYGFSIYDSDNDDDYINITIVVDSFNIRGYILKSTLDKCMIGLNSTIITPLIWLVQSDGKLFAFTADCEEYKIAVKHNYKYIDINEIPLYSKIIIEDGTEAYLLSKHGKTIRGMNYNYIANPGIVLYIEEDIYVFDSEKAKDKFSNIIYYDASTKLKQHIIDSVSTQFVDLSSSVATITVENSIKSDITDNSGKDWLNHIVHYTNISNLVYYIPELNGYFVELKKQIYSVDIGTSYTITENNTCLLEKVNLHTMTLTKFHKYTKEAALYSIKSIDYK